MLIDPKTLVGQQLRLRKTAEADYTVRVADLAAGRIMRKPVAGGSTVWLWTVTGPYVPPKLQPSHGDAESLDAAKEAFKVKFRAWLLWANSRSGEATWNGWPGTTAASPDS